MGNPRNRSGRVGQLIDVWEERSRKTRSGQTGQRPPKGAPPISSIPPAPVPASTEPSAPPSPREEDNDVLIQGLTPGQLRVLAIKVYDLMLEELRLEAERTGKRSVR